MRLNNCKSCGIEWQSMGNGSDLCAVCLQKPQSRHPLADAPPLPAAEIEAIKVAMLQTGWVWKE